MKHNHPNEAQIQWKKLFVRHQLKQKTYKTNNSSLCWVRYTHSGNYEAWGASGDYKARGASGDNKARGASGGKYEA